MKVNPDALTRKFWVVVLGNKLPVLQSVAAKKGSKTEACAIVGLGEDAPVGPDACVPGCGNFNPDQTLKRIETIVFKGCAVRFEFDLNTGEVTSASNDPSESPNPNCSALIVSDAADLEITLTGYGTLGKGKFGDGTIATGSTSCPTRVIGAKVYTWGDPCP